MNHRAGGQQEPARGERAPLDEEVIMSWGARALDFAAVLIGGLLGFALSGWQADRADRALVEQSAEAMIAELATNFDAILESRAYHVWRFPYIVEAREADGDGSAITDRYRGLQSPRLRTAAYQARLAAAVFTRSDVERATAITGAYEALDQLDATDATYRSAFPMIQVESARFLEFLSFTFADLMHA
jgi:hypothetical protein